MKVWSDRITESLDLSTEEGQSFSERFKLNLFLQFRFVTLHQFQTVMLQIEIYLEAF